MANVCALFRVCTYDHSQQGGRQALLATRQAFSFRCQEVGTAGPDIDANDKVQFNLARPPLCKGLTTTPHLFLTLDRSQISEERREEDKNVEQSPRLLAER